MTDRNDFDMYTNSNNKKTVRKKNIRLNNEEFGSEEIFKNKSSKNVESFSDWVDKMMKEHEK